MNNHDDCSFASYDWYRNFKDIGDFTAKKLAEGIAGNYYEIRDSGGNRMGVVLRTESTSGNITFEFLTSDPMSLVNKNQWIKAIVSL